MHVCQTNISRNPNIGTLRGMHFQALPYEEAKIVHCVRGSVFDAIVDLRPTSLTYCRTAWTRLSADEERLVYVPAWLCSRLSHPRAS